MAGYKYIGKRIYYLKVDGGVILDTGEAEGWVIQQQARTIGESTQN